MRKRFSNPKNFVLNAFLVGFKFRDMSEAFTEFSSLLRGNGAINGGLDFSQRGFAAFIDKRRNVKSLAGMVQDELDDGRGGPAKDIREHIIEFEVGNSETVESPVLLADEHVGEFEAVAHQVTEMPNIRRGNKAGLNHVTHEEVTDPFGILAVGLVALLRFGVLRVGKSNTTGFFEDVKDWDPVLAGRFHTNFCTGVFGKPVGQLLKSLGKGREASLLVLSQSIGIGNADAGKDPGFVDIEATAVFTKDFKHEKNLLQKISRAGRDWSSGEIESISEEISLRATFLRHSLMP